MDLEAAGHLAVLAERSKAGSLEVILFDGIIGADWTWSQDLIPPQVSGIYGG